MTDEFGPDPAADRRANYDYRSSDAANSDLVTELSDRTDGDVRFDSYSRQLYATDASAYEITPVGVVCPRSTDDVAEVVAYCAEEDVPVLPRGAGTSLAGQAVNEAVVLDLSRYMDDVVTVDPDESVATAQAGIRLGDLNEAVGVHGLKFAPDPAWGDKSTLGGAIGNNSSGSHSLVYGKTDAYVETCEAVLADGTVTTFGEVSLETLESRAAPDGDLEGRIYAAIERIVTEEAGAIADAYPEIERNVSGYNLDRLIDEAATGSVNLARLLAGSEGTLAIVTEATVSLEPVPETKAVALLTYRSLNDAMADVAPILEHDPAAVEVLDDVLLDLAADTQEFGVLVDDIVPDGTESLLLVEFYAGDQAEGKRKVADLVADRVQEHNDGADPPAAARPDAPRRAFDVREAYDPERRNRFWKLRKSGLPILLSRTTDEKHVSFIEDCAVPPEQLPSYVDRFQEILADHDTFASFYGHAGPGVLHVRPLVNVKSDVGRDRMQSIAEEVTEFVVERGGSVSGEHGDGRARTQWNRTMYGDHLWHVFEALKTAFDPDWLLNPGQVCGDVEMTEHLRGTMDDAFDAGFDPSLDWENENGVQGMVELCHGCGGCRGSQDTTGGVMCPTYRAANEESLSTRGRANALRQAMTGRLPEDEQFDVEFMAEIVDLCIGCKGCARDCPSEVDMAKLKAEIEHEYHDRHGATRRERLFRDTDRFAALGSALAPLSNWAPKLPGSRRLLEATLGIARERSLPTFARETFEDWFAARESTIDPGTAAQRVVLVPDTFTNYIDPAIGKATVRVLESAGVHVEVASVSDVGRSAYSLGFLDEARERSVAASEALAPRVADGRDVVVPEPSDAVMLQSDATALSGEPAVQHVAENTYGVMEYLNTQSITVEPTAVDETVTYHGHCHQKATRTASHAVDVLRDAGLAVDRLDSGCCGMAGSFGYEAEHVSMSFAIGDVLLEQVQSASNAVVAAPGASCRAQVRDLAPERDVVHPITVLERSVA